MIDQATTLNRVSYLEQMIHWMGEPGNKYTVLSHQKLQDINEGKKAFILIQGNPREK